MKKFTMLFFMIFIAASLFIVNGCDALNSDKDDDDPNNPTTTNAGNILGTVKSTWNSGIGGVTVKVNNLTTTTNDQGWFTLPEVPPGTRVQVKFELNGYVSTSEIVNVVVGQSTFIEVVMAQMMAPLLHSDKMLFQITVRQLLKQLISILLQVILRLHSLVILQVCRMVRKELLNHMVL